MGVIARPNGPSSAIGRLPFRPLDALPLHPLTDGPEWAIARINGPSSERMFTKIVNNDRVARALFKWL
jgi:hypothetical protein